MREPRKSQYQRVSVKYSVICATSGLALALLLCSFILGVGAISQRIVCSSIIAVITLYAAAIIFGLLAGRIIYWVGVSGLRIWLIGVGLAWSCLLLSVFAGSSLNFLTEWYKEPSVADAFTEWIIKPAFWVVLFGGLPASGLGLFYAARIKKVLSVG